MQRLRTALSPWRALLLAALLLAAQAAGLAHRLAHGPAQLHDAVAGLFWGHAAPHAHQGEHGHAGTDAAAECRLVDQLLGHADALVAAAAPTVLGGCPLALAPSGPLDQGRRSAAAYQARAPPLA